LFVAYVSLYREGLAATLRSHPSVRIIATAGTQADAQVAAEELRPDVVVIDMTMAGAFELTSALRTQSPRLRLIAFALHEEVSVILDCAEAGAHGFVTAGASLDDFIAAVERVVAGELLCTPRVVAELFRGLGERSVRGAGRHPVAAHLTGREQQVLTLLSRGLSNKEIGASLNIAEATVKNHVHNLLEKLHVERRGQAAARAMLSESVRG
jgi:DNA-binding NarL/FixJ family response regulator